MTARPVLALLAAAAVGAPGCGGGSGPTAPQTMPGAPAALSLRLPDARGGRLPAAATCAGAGVSPALRWSGVPRGTRELVLVVTDPDAPGGRVVHWTLAELEPGRTALRAGERPPGAAEGENSFGGKGYGPACPPKGARAHRYVFDLYALAHRSGLARGASPGEVASAVGEALARGEAVARYSR